MSLEVTQHWGDGGCQAVGWCVGLPQTCLFLSPRSGLVGWMISNVFRSSFEQSLRFLNIDTYRTIWMKMSKALLYQMLEWNHESWYSIFLSGIISFRKAWLIIVAVSHLITFEKFSADRKRINVTSKPGGEHMQLRWKQTNTDRGSVTPLGSSSLQT